MASRRPSVQSKVITPSRKQQPLLIDFFKSACIKKEIRQPSEAHSGGLAKVDASQVSLQQRDTQNNDYVGTVTQDSCDNESDQDVPVRSRKRLRRTLCRGLDSDTEEDGALAPFETQPSIFDAEGTSSESQATVQRGATIGVKTETCLASLNTCEEFSNEGSTEGTFMDNGGQSDASSVVSGSRKSSVNGLSVLDLTYERAETVWPQLQLSSNANMASLARSRLLKKLEQKTPSLDLSSSQESVSTCSEQKDWSKWLQSLPIAVNSRYFQEYIDVIGSTSLAASVSSQSSTEVSSIPGNEESRVTSFPSWLLPDKLCDKAQHRPDHPDYDVGTIYVPRESKMEPKHTTPAMKQYWDFKADHFDKIVFFKLGKFYEIFYVDAFIANRICHLRWMGSDEKPHVGFPESSLHQYAQLLVSEGFKVVVVEQMETPKELDERNRDARPGETKSKTVRREVCEVYSVGTVLHEAMLPTDSRLLMAIAYNSDKTQFGFAYADVSTSRIWVGDWALDATMHKGPIFEGILSPVSQALKTLFGQVSPVEVILDQLNVPNETLRIVKLLPVPPHLNVMPIHHQSRDSNYWSEVLPLVGSGLRCDVASHSQMEQRNAGVLEYVRQMEDVSSAFILLCRYLESVLLLEKVLAFVRLEQVTLYGNGGSQSSTSSAAVNAAEEVECEAPSQLSCRLIMDNVTLRHLSVLQASDGRKAGSLLEYLDRTTTPMGSRLLKRWLAAPLRLPEHINQRLDSVTWLLKHPEQRDSFRSTVAQLPDVERLLARVCTRGLQKLRGAVYFDNIHAKQFRQFSELLDAFATIQQSLCRLVEDSEDSVALPQRLRQLCCVVTTRAQGTETGCLPDLVSAFQDIKNCLTFDQQTNEWALVQNVDEEYDRAVGAIEDVKRSIESYLVTLLDWARKSSRWTPSTSTTGIRYVHSKFPYEIEVPEHHVLVKIIQAEDDTAKNVTSSRAGFIRFRTSKILDLVEQLDDQQCVLKSVLYGCQERLFKKFYGRYYDACLRTLSALAEVDILSGFAVLASSGVEDAEETASRKIPPSERMCRPRIIAPACTSGKNSTPREAPILRLIHSRHPLVASALPPGTHYVTNDIRLNDTADSAGSHSFFLVTGPNMGGKSTLLRQTCLSVILAQVGSYVPASECVLTPVDRIFTRIGAYDSILEGRSAFLVEMEEAIPAVSDATVYSLAVLDELGRGTSSCDGAALALAVAEHLATVVKARCLFSTHFQLVADELTGVPSVRSVHMGIHLDPITASLTFLYTLTPEACARSHGLHVARLAGMAEEIINAAHQRAEDLHEMATQVHTRLRLEALATDILTAARDKEETPDIWKNFRRRFMMLTKDPTSLALLCGGTEDSSVVG